MQSRTGYDAGLLNEALAFALEFGEHWLQPVRGRVRARHPSLGESELDTLEGLCQEARRFANGFVREQVATLGAQACEGCLRAELNARYPWANEANLRMLCSEAMYYAWKDGQC